MFRKSLFILGIWFTCNYTNAQWYSLVSGTTHNLLGVDFKDTLNGFVVGGSLDESTIMKTVDGGNNWQITSFSNSKYLYDVLFLDSTTIITCGYDGVIYKSSDNGATWSMKPSETTEWLYGMYFHSPLIGYAVGSKGMVIKTTNGGDNWSKKNTGTNLLLLSIDFANDTLGFAVGKTGRIIKTTDAGETWKNINTPFLETLNSVYCFNKDTIWAVGEFGRVIKSENGGEDWAAINFSTERNFQSITFANEKAAYIINNKEIFKTVDAGNSWQQEINPLLSDLHSVNMIKNEAFIVGKDGTILKNTQIPLNIENIDFKNTLLVYPNPTKDYFQFKIDANDVFNVDIYSINGQLVAKYLEVDNSKIFSSQSLESGIYICKVSSKQGIYFTKLIKE